MDYSGCIGFCEPGDAECIELHGENHGGGVAGTTSSRPVGLSARLRWGWQTVSVVLSGTSCLHGGSDPVHLREVLSAPPTNVVRAAKSAGACEKKSARILRFSRRWISVCRIARSKSRAYGRIDPAMFAGELPDVLDACYDFPFEEEAADGGEGATEEGAKEERSSMPESSSPEHLAVQCSR